MKYNKQKLEQFTKKHDNAEQPSPSVRQSSVEKRDFTAVFCVICKKSPCSWFLYTTKQSVNANHNKEMTENWKSMALKVGHKTLLNGHEMLLKNLSTGDSSSNESHYHAKCNKSLWNQCIKTDKENRRHNMKWRQAEAYENIVSFVLEQEAIEPCSTFVVKDLNKLYIKILKSFGIEEKAQTTRFNQQLFNIILNLVSSTINKNTVVLFGDKVDELTVDYVNSPDEFYAAL